MGITVIDTQPETLKYHTQPIDSIADTQLGVATQCMLGKHVPKANKRYCTNLCPKVDNKIAYAAIVWDRFFFGQGDGQGLCRGRGRFVLRVPSSRIADRGWPTRQR